jgi:glycosyltransferase involved in cell wall biosynthesis
MEHKYPLKINLIIPSFFPAVIYGGPIFSTLNTSKELAKLENVEVHVSTTNANMGKKLDVEVNQPIKFEQKLFVKYYDELIVDKLSLQLMLNVWKDIKNSDVVHIQAIFNTPIPISLFWSWIFRKPTILTPRGSLGDWVMNNGSKFKCAWLNILIKPFAKYVIWHATSKQEEGEILKHFPEANVSIIPNGIDFSYFQNSNVLSRFEFINKFTGKDISPKKIVVSMGRLQKKKGFDILIDSFEQVLNSLPNSILLIAGADEGEESNLKRQIKRLNLEKNVFLVGAIEGQDKIDFLANADLFCLPSHNENFGNVYVESLASGTPIVASRQTPWCDVEKFNCGKWVENSIEETSNAMYQMLIEDKKMMSHNSKKLAREYDWHNVAFEFKKLYESILK